MATLEELQRQNRILRAKLESKRDLMNIQNERNKLLAENKKLMREEKYGGAIRMVSKIGKSVGGTGLKVGKTLGRGLFAWARMIERNERMGRRLDNQARKIKPSYRKKRR